MCPSRFLTISLTERRACHRARGNTWFPCVGPIGREDSLPFRHDEFVNQAAVSPPRLAEPPGFRRSWVQSTLPAEAAGFAIPATAGLLAWKSGIDGLPFFLVMVAAGAGEGVALGAGQAHALLSRLPGIERSWILATGIAASLAWACGMAPSTLRDAGVPGIVVGAVAPVLALILLASIGTAQWLLLRRNIARAGRWVWMNAVAWVVGLPPTIIIPMLLPNDSPPGVWLGGFIVAGILMATIVALITGAFMDKLLTEAGK